MRQAFMASQEEHSLILLLCVCLHAAAAKRLLRLCALWQAFMASQEGQPQGRLLRSGTFARWVADRKELKHLMGSLTLEPAV